MSAPAISPATSLRRHRTVQRGSGGKNGQRLINTIAKTTATAITTASASPAPTTHPPTTITTITEGGGTGEEGGQRMGRVNTPPAHLCRGETRDRRQQLQPASPLRHSVPWPRHRQPPAPGSLLQRLPPTRVRVHTFRSLQGEFLPHQRRFLHVIQPLGRMQSRSLVLVLIPSTRFTATAQC